VHRTDCNILVLNYVFGYGRYGKAILQRAVEEYECD